MFNVLYNTIQNREPVMGTTNNGSGFAQEIQVFFRTAQDLGRLWYQGDRIQFGQTLQAIGMNAAEAEGYFDLIANMSAGEREKESAGDWAPMDYSDACTVKSNYSLARGLGILLKNEAGQPPRNWLLYQVFEHFFPNMLQAKYFGNSHLRAKETRGGNPQHRAIRFSTLPVEPSGVCNREGNPMPLYRAVQGREPAKFQAEAIRMASHLRAALGESLGMQLADLLLRLQMLIPSESISRALVPVFESGARGEEITFAGAFCPDYAYEETGNTQVPYRYTFDGLGTGVGLVARQFARIIPELSRFFTGLGIPHRFVISIGDFEADAESVLQRVGVDRVEFIRRCQCSLDAFQALMPEDVPIELELFDAKRGNGKFRTYALECTNRMINGDFGMMPILHPDLHEVIGRIPGQYRTFYQRWYGVEMDDETVRNIVYSQGGEYAAVARIYYEDLGKNIVFLAGDRPEMNRFDAFSAPVPVLCAKRAY